MKEFSVFALFSCILISACQAGGIQPLKWFNDGRIQNAQGSEIQLNIQNAYDGIDYNENTYIAGFKIGKDGTNTPTIAKVANDLKNIQYWSFETIINDIFIYQNKLHIVDTGGVVTALANDTWQKSSLNFPKRSEVVYSNKKDHLIICHAASRQKAGSHSGSGCYAISPTQKQNWKMNFTWFDQTPRVCNGTLHTFEAMRKGGVFRAVDLNTGKVDIEQQFSEPPKDLCNITN